MIKYQLVESACLSVHVRLRAKIRQNDFTFSESLVFVSLRLLLRTSNAFNWRRREHRVKKNEYKYIFSQQMKSSLFSWPFPYTFRSDSSAACRFSIATIIIIIQSHTAEEPYWILHGRYTYGVAKRCDRLFVRLIVTRQRLQWYYFRMNSIWFRFYPHRRLYCSTRNHHPLKISHWIH